MTPTVYPKMGPTPHKNVSPFFSAIPRAVGDLRAAGILKARDVDVLRELLDYKNRRSTQVDPKQATLAARFGCSVDTVQRSLKRLEAAGLIAIIRLRDRLGRLGRCVYDLAGTLFLMPHHAAKLRSGDWGQSGHHAAEETPLKSPVPAIPQNCGLSEVDSKDDAKADSKAAVDRDKNVSHPVAVALAAEGVYPGVAGSLVVKFGEGRCRQVLSALKKRKQVRDRAAWLVGALLQGWNVTTEADTTRPQAHHAYTPPAAAAQLDPLTALDTAARNALEAQAKALLLHETHPAWRDKLLHGKNTALLHSRMRELLSAQQ